MTWMQGNKSCNYWDFIFSFHSNLHTHNGTHLNMCVWMCVTCIWTSIYFNTWLTVWLSVYLPPLFLLLPRWLYCRFFYSYPAGYVHVILTFHITDWMTEWVTVTLLWLCVCVLSPLPLSATSFVGKYLVCIKYPFYWIQHYVRQESSSVRC